MMTNQNSQLDQVVGRVLRAGVTMSSVALSIGLGLSMLTGMAGAAHLLLNVGLVILLATPVARVVVSVAEYAFERDWVFALLTTIVLLELVGSLIAAVR